MYNTEYMQERAKFAALIEASTFAASVLYCHSIDMSGQMAFEKLKTALNALGIDVESKAMREHKEWLESRHA